MQLVGQQIGLNEQRLKRLVCDLEVVIASIRYRRQTPMKPEREITLLEEEADAFTDLGNLRLKHKFMVETLPGYDTPEDFFKKALELRVKIINHEVEKASGIVSRLPNSKREEVFTEYLIQLGKLTNS